MINNVNLIFGMPEDIYEKIRIEAFEKKVSKAEICRRALQEHYEDENS